MATSNVLDLELIVVEVVVDPCPTSKNCWSAFARFGKLHQALRLANSSERTRKGCCFRSEDSPVDMLPLASFASAENFLISSLLVMLLLELDTLDVWTLLDIVVPWLLRWR